MRGLGRISWRSRPYLSQLYMKQRNKKITNNRMYVMCGGGTLNFCIQAGNPKVQCTLDDTDKCLSDAIETIFPLYTENAILVWNHICIPLSYKYDISYMMDDIISLLSSLQREKSGRKVIHWLPDTFRCDWFVKWGRGELEIRSKWECTEVLNNVMKGLELCGYDASKIGGMEALIKCCNDIKESGIYYRNG